MKLIKMSLAAAAAVAGLSTASFAGGHMKNDGMAGGLNISGNADVRWKSVSQGDMTENGSTREKFDLNVVSKSKDGKGKAHIRFRYEGTGASGSTALVNKAYVTYKIGKSTIGMGPKIGFPGAFSFSTIRGFTYKVDMGAFTLGAAVGDKDTGSEVSEKSIITAKAKVPMATIKLDYRLGADKNEYLATKVDAKFGPVAITTGYVAGQGDNNEDKSIMGALAKYSLGNHAAYAAFSISGDEGGDITERNKYKYTDDGDALGGIPGSQGKKVTAMKFGAKTKLVGTSFQAYYSMAMPDADDADDSSRIYVDAARKLNAQSSVNLRYYMDDSGKEGDDTKNTIEFRIASKF